MSGTLASEVQVRLARREDVPAIVRLLADDPLGATRERPGEPLAEAYWNAFDAMTAQNGNELLVADVGGEVVGCLQLTVIPGLSRTGMTRGQIEGVRVSARHRGQRLGEALVLAAIERSRELGCRLVQLTTDRTRGDAQRFYERLGFEATHVGMKLMLGVLLIVSIAGCERQTLAERDTTASAAKLMSPFELQALPVRAPDHRVAYGDDSNQFGELRLPSSGGPHPVVVLVHGGCWKEPYATLRDLGPMGDALKAEGVATWNVEYRRLDQAGSGWPGTYLDVGRAIDHLRSIAGQYSLDLNRVVVVGHSAGGHLAMWAGARRRLPRGSALSVANPLPLRGVMNLAGTMDMTDNISNMEQQCRDTVVTAMLGGRPADVPDRYAQASAFAMLPLGIPQVLVWGSHEEFVPRPLAEKYTRTATQAGDSARLVIVPGAGHFEIASPFSTAWPAVRSALSALLDGRLPPPNGQ